MKRLSSEFVCSLWEKDTKVCACRYSGHLICITGSLCDLWCWSSACQDLDSHMGICDETSVLGYLRWDGSPSLWMAPSCRRVIGLNKKNKRSQAPAFTLPALRCHVTLCLMLWLPWLPSPFHNDRDPGTTSQSKLLLSVILTKQWEK